MLRSQLGTHYEDLGIRLARIQRHLREKFRDSMLRVLLLEA